MRYSEAKKQLKEIRLVSKKLATPKISICDEVGSDYVKISTTEKYVIDSDYMLFKSLSDEKREKLGKIMFELAATPIEEREDEQLYYVLFMNNDFKFDTSYNLFLNYNLNTNKLGKNTKANVDVHQTKFTMGEIETHISKLHMIMPDTNFSDIERGYKVIPVEEIDA